MKAELVFVNNQPDDLPIIPTVRVFDDFASLRLQSSPESEIVIFLRNTGEAQLLGEAIVRSAQQSIDCR